MNFKVGDRLIRIKDTEGSLQRGFLKGTIVTVKSKLGVNLTFEELTGSWYYAYFELANKQLEFDFAKGERNA